jgi:hypothetical protein
MQNMFSLNINYFMYRQKCNNISFTKTMLQLFITFARITGYDLVIKIYLLCFVKQMMRLMLQH